jgi:lysophospholipase L1-like esterase
VRTTIGGDCFRIKLSNEFGTTALALGGAHIALTRLGHTTVPESDHVLKFGGEQSVSIPPKSPILSDPVNLNVPAFSEITISIYLPSKVMEPTTHFWGQHETYISGPGDFSAQPDILNATVKTSWYFLADAEVCASDATATVVTLGDSITDGVGAKQGDYVDWPDVLAERLATDHKARRLAIANAGIRGNQVLHDGAGMSALARFDRDVLAKPGVAYLIVLEGINDIVWPTVKPRTLRNRTPKDLLFAHEVVSAEELVGGLRQIINRAHAHGLKVFGGTLTPYEHADSYTSDGEAKRQIANQWIRTSRSFDAVFDFDAALRDPNHPSRLRQRYDSGDHVHPSAAGYQAMANLIDLSLFESDSSIQK